MADLTTDTRDALPEGDFALPGRRYPIHDAAHARNALARVAQHGTPGEQARVRAAVHSKFPEIGKEGSMQRHTPKIASLRAHLEKRAYENIQPVRSGKVVAAPDIPLRPDPVAHAQSVRQHGLVGTPNTPVPAQPKVTMRAVPSLAEVPVRAPAPAARPAPATPAPVASTPAAAPAPTAPAAHAPGATAPGAASPHVTPTAAVTEAETAAAKSGLGHEVSRLAKAHWGKALAGTALVGAGLYGAHRLMNRQPAQQAAAPAKQAGLVDHFVERGANGAVKGLSNLGVASVGGAVVTPIVVHEGLKAHRRAVAAKQASLPERIAGTINQTDFDVFEGQFKEAAVAELLPGCPSVLAALSKIASAGVGARGRFGAMAKVAQAQRMDVVQVRPTQYGYLVKWAAAPDGAAEPQQQEMSVPQAQQALPPEMLQTADQQGVATVTSVEAEPDPLEETPQPVEGFGMYKVYEAGTGKQMVGFVIPSLFDPRTGQAVPTRLFINGGQYAMQPDIVGVLVGISYNLPAGGAEPRGLGVFYKTDGKGIVATIPFNVMTSVTVEGRQYYAAQTSDGLEVQIVPSDGMRRPTMAGQEIAMPADYTWLPLDNEIQLEGAGMGSAASGNAPDVMAATKRASMPTMGRIRAWSDGSGNVSQVLLDGPVFSKVASLQNDVADALFFMAAAGMPQNLSVEVIEKAASAGTAIKLYGLQPLGAPEQSAKTAAADALAGLTGIKIPPRHCLLKEAMALEMHKEAKALVGVDSLDTLLSIGFINPENIQDFVDCIPDLEETQSKLSSLVFATQLGLQSVPKTAAIRAMNSLEDVLKGLRGLKSYKL